MNLSEVPEFSLSSPAQLVLGWPEEDGGPPVAEARALCLLKRAGGLLLAVPAHFFDEDLLLTSQNAPPSEVLGPSEFFECSAAIVAEDRLVEHALPITVLVIDCSESICANLRVVDPAEDGAETFVQEDPSLLPYVPSLLSQVDLWIRASDRQEFYSLDEGEATEAIPKAKAAAGKAKAKAKQSPSQRRMSAAVLEAALSVLPALNTRLDELADRQSRLEEAGKAAPSAVKPPLHAQIGLTPPASKALLPHAAAGLVGPPPNARAANTALGSQDLVPLRSSSVGPYGWLPRHPESSVCLPRTGFPGQWESRHWLFDDAARRAASSNHEQPECHVGGGPGKSFCSPSRSEGDDFFGLPPRARPDYSEKGGRFVGSTPSSEAERRGRGVEKEKAEGQGKVAKEAGVVVLSLASLLEGFSEHSLHVGPTHSHCAFVPLSGSRFARTPKSLGYGLDRGCSGPNPGCARVAEPLPSPRPKLVSKANLPAEPRPSLTPKTLVGLSNKGSKVYGDRPARVHSPGSLSVNACSLPPVDFKVPGSLGVSPVPANPLKSAPAPKHSLKAARCPCSSQDSSALPGTVGDVPDFDGSMPFTSFLASLPRRILACKTKFSHFLFATFHLHRSGESASSSALFPLPVPFPGVFDGSGPKLSLKRCKSLMLKRGVHVIAMCLNYVFCGRKWIPPAELRRPPSPSHVAAFDRIRRFLCACGSSAPQVISCPGRRSHELTACLRSLFRFVDREGPSGGFGYKQGGPLGGAPTKDRDRPELRPYTNLRADRLKLSGTAGFWPLPYLQPNLILPFLEPKVLRFQAEEPLAPHPTHCTDHPEELLSLYRKWDQNGLLGFTDSYVDEWQKVRVFNCRKSDQVDRQIGDRRSLNLIERSLPGPSADLPIGSLLCNIVLGTKSVLCAAITDRRDFYHQIMITPQRAESNAVGFRLPLNVARSFKNASAALKQSGRFGREAVGDGLHLAGLGAGRVGGKRGRTDSLQPVFCSLFQGTTLEWNLLRLPMRASCRKLGSWLENLD